MKDLNSSDYIYKNITKINELFLEHNFNIYHMGTQVPYELTYSQGINICDEYKLRIDRINSKIHITIPLKNSNISFNTSFSTLETAYDFLEFHIK